MRPLGVVVAAAILGCGGAATDDAGVKAAAGGAASTAGGAAGGSVAGGGEAGGTAAAGGGVTGGGTAGGSAGGASAGGGDAGGSSAGGGALGGGGAAGGAAAGGNAGGLDGGAADAGAGIDAGPALSITAVALAARGAILELMVAGPVGVDGGAPLFHLSRLDGGWTTATRRPEATLEPLSLDVVAWDEQRFDYVYLGACGASRRTTCQHFWQGGFSTAYDLGVPDGGAGVFASTIVSPSRTRLSVYAIAPSGVVFRTAWLGASWTSWAEYPWVASLDVPLGARAFDGVAVSAFSGEEAITKFIGHDAPGLFMSGWSQTALAGSPAVYWDAWRRAPRAPPAGLQLSVRPSIAVLPDAGPAIVELVNTGVLVTEAVTDPFPVRFVSAQGWLPVTPGVVSLDTGVGPSCVGTAHGVACAVATRAPAEVWLVQFGPGGTTWERGGAIR